MTLSGEIGIFRQLRRGTGGFFLRGSDGAELDIGLSSTRRTCLRTRHRRCAPWPECMAAPGDPSKSPGVFAFLLAPPSPYDPNGAAYAASGSLWCCLVGWTCRASPLAGGFVQWQLGSSSGLVPVRSRLAALSDRPIAVGCLSNGVRPTRSIRPITHNDPRAPSVQCGKRIIQTNCPTSVGGKCHCTLKIYHPIPDPNQRPVTPSPDR